MTNGLEERGRGLFEYIRSHALWDTKKKDVPHQLGIQSKFQTDTPLEYKSRELSKYQERRRVSIKFRLGSPRERTLDTFSKGLESHRTGLNGITNRKREFLLEIESRLPSP